MIRSVTPCPYALRDFATECPLRDLLRGFVHDPNSDTHESFGFEFVETNNPPPMDGWYIDDIEVWFRPHNDFAGSREKFQGSLVIAD